MAHIVGPLAGCRAWTPGRGIAEGVSLLSVGERGRAAPPAGDPPGTAKKSRAQDGSTWANIGLKMGEHCPKMGQHVAQDGSTWANIGLKMGEHSPRWGNIAPKMG